MRFSTENSPCKRAQLRGSVLLTTVALLSVSTTMLDLAPETPLSNSGMCRVGLRYPPRHLLSQKLKCGIKCTIKDQRYGLCNEARHTIR